MTGYRLASQHSSKMDFFMNVHKKDTGKQREDPRRQYSDCCNDRQIPSDLGEYLDNRNLTTCPPGIAENIECDPKWEIGVTPGDGRDKGVSRWKSTFPVEECREKED